MIQIDTMHTSKYSFLIAAVLAISTLARPQIKITGAGPGNNLFTCIDPSGSAIACNASDTAPGPSDSAPDTSDDSNDIDSIDITDDTDDSDNTENSDDVNENDDSGKDVAANALSNVPVTPQMVAALTVYITMTPTSTP